MTRLEEANLFIDVWALGGGRRTDDDQRVRGVERGKRQRIAGGDVVAVMKYRAQRLMDRAGGVAPHKVLVTAEAFKPAMQPLRRVRVGVTVGNECAVLERDGLIHPKGNADSWPTAFLLRENKRKASQNQAWRRRTGAD